MAKPWIMAGLVLFAASMLPAAGAAAQDAAAGLVPGGGGSYSIPEGAVPGAQTLGETLFATQAPPGVGVRQVRPRINASVRFAFDSAEVPLAFRPVLDNIATAMRSFPGSRLVVEGHTDAVGAAGYNRNLSERRARAVVDYLARQHGIASSRLQAVGKGETELLNPANPAAAENRRVTFTIP